MKNIVSIVLVSVSTLFLAHPCTADQSLVYVFNMESGELRTEGLDHGVKGHGNPPELSMERSRHGKYSMRSYVHRLDSEVSNRSEVSLSNRRIVRNNFFGEDYWYGFSIFIPKDYQPADVWEVLAQWHGQPDKDIGESWRSPPLSLNSGPNGTWQIVSRWDNRVKTPDSDPMEYGGVQRWRLGSIKQDKGKWVDWVFHVKWSWQLDGELEVWKDGEERVVSKGPNAFNDKLGPYFKMGVYLGWKDRACCTKGPVEREIFHDELRVAVGENARFEDVSPSEYSDN